MTVTGTEEMDTQTLPKADHAVPPSSPAPMPLTFINDPSEGSSFIAGHPKSTRFTWFRASHFPRWRVAYVCCLVASDVAVMLLALIVSLSMKSSAYQTIRHSISMQVFIVLQCAVWILCMQLTGTYERHVTADGYALYTKIVNAAILTIVVFSCVAYMLNINLPRTVVIISPLVACALAFLSRWLLRRALYSQRRRGHCKYETVIVGSNEGINSTLRNMASNPDTGLKPVALCPVRAIDNTGQKDMSVVPDRFVPDEDTVSADQLQVLALDSLLPQTVSHLNAQSVLIVDTIERESELMQALSVALESLGLELAVSTTVADISGHQLQMHNLTTGFPILTARMPQYSALTLLFKRLTDIVGSLAAIVVSLPLVMLPVAIAIKLDDGGPILYRQERIGRNGVPFQCLKFRSMRVHDDSLDDALAQGANQGNGVLFKLCDDPRVTRVGRFIRKYSLDEFPQFFNVLKGDMSLVGPRPHLQREVDQFGMLYSTRLLVKPGITGPWQISGRSNLSQEEAERLDVSYIEHWSIGGDIAILAKTVVAVLRHTGAY